MSFRTITLRERLAMFPPFLCFALTRVKMPPMTREERNAKFCVRKNRRLRQMLKSDGVELPRRKSHRRMTVEELAEVFPKEVRWYVPRLVRKVDWKDVQIGDALTFMDACGLDILAIKRVRYELSKGNKNGRAICHLTDAQKRDFAKLAKAWKKLCLANEER